MGLIAVLLIFIPIWAQHQKLEMAQSLGLLAMVFYLFFGINVFAFTGLTAFQQYLAIINRLSQVFCLDEYRQTRDEAITYE